MPQPLLGREDRRWEPERWRPIAETRTAGPWEHTSEPPRFRRSVANPERDTSRPGGAEARSAPGPCINRMCPWDQAYYPVAMVKFQWRGEEEPLKVGVLPHLAEDIIIATDYTAFLRLLSKAGEEHMMKKWWEEVPYDTEVAEPLPSKPQLSKQQKRLQKRQHWEENHGNTKTPGVMGKVYTVAGDFRQSQREDPSLKNAWAKALSNKEAGEKRNRQLRRALPRKTPQPLFRRADRRWEPERWRPVAETRTAGPGEHTSEPPHFRRSVANPGTGVLDGECSRLSGDAAPRAEWRCSRGRANSVSSYHDDRGAGVSKTRLDFWDEKAVESDDGVAQREDGGERERVGAERSPNKDDPEQPSEETKNPDANDRRNKEPSKDALRTCHVPGGTWLSKEARPKIFASQAGNTKGTKREYGLRENQHTVTPIRTLK
ncbi:hypothetical protein NDU88_000397 [Pleurodeles waltl]|uniref:Uncharacterized protein n=1 Tax=Pleurodeles waltl TaxID=8319 RepID=A0AAV7NBS7_PLEWA|nr:hypothetical protein NDU88_000397 [Pleurodeles waltl]